MQSVRLARQAMATRFEFVLWGEDPVRLRAAGEEALDEISRIESRLSLYQPGSEIAQVNARAANEAVRVSPEIFELLLRALDYSRMTGGAFDITIAPLVRCWGFMKGNGERPSDEAIAAARALAGMDLLELDETHCTVRFQKPGMMLDLGAIGKGYAMDAASGLVRDAGVERALLHGGTSTVCAIGTQPDGLPWKIAIENPLSRIEPLKEERPMLKVVSLSDRTLSVSAVSGKFFVLDGRTYGHVVDPRTGWPAANALLGAVTGPSATEGDALSTAVLLSTAAELNEFRWPGIAWLQARLDPQRGPGEVEIQEGPATTPEKIIN